MLRHYGLQREGLTFLKVGGFEPSDIGTHCFHAKTGAVELLLNHLTDGPENTVAVDMTAGADAFASGLFTRFDLTVLMVEPTLQSVSVFRQYCDYAGKYGICIRAVGNKVADSGDLGFLQAELGEALLGVFGASAFVKRRDRGVHGSIGELEPDNRAVLQTLERELRAVRRDACKYWQHSIDFHMANAASWANAMTGQDLGLQVDRDYLDHLSA